jgi:hypothetical protein
VALFVSSLQISPVSALGKVTLSNEAMIAFHFLSMAVFFIIGSVADLLLIKFFLKNSDFAKQYKIKTFCYIWSVFIFSIFSGISMARFSAKLNIDYLLIKHGDISIEFTVIALILSLFFLFRSIKKLDAPEKQFRDFLISMMILSISLFAWPDIQLIYKIGLLTFLIFYFLFTPIKYDEKIPATITWFFSVAALFCWAMHINVITTLDSFFFNGALTWQFLLWLIVSITLLIILHKKNNWKKYFFRISLFILIFSLSLMSVYLRNDNSKMNIKAFKLNAGPIQDNLLIFLTVPKKVSEILINDKLRLHLEIKQMYNSFIDLGKDVWSHLEKEDYYWNSFWISPIKPQSQFSLENPYIKGKSLRNGVTFGIEDFTIDEELKKELLMRQKLEKEVVFNVYVLMDSQGIATVKGVELLKVVPQRSNKKGIKIELYQEPEFDIH